MYLGENVTEVTKMIWVESGHMTATAAPCMLVDLVLTKTLRRFCGKSLENLEKLR